MRFKAVQVYTGRPARVGDVGHTRLQELEQHAHWTRRGAGRGGWQFCVTRCWLLMPRVRSVVGGL